MNHVTKNMELYVLTLVLVLFFMISYHVATELNTMHDSVELYIKGVH